MSQLATRRLIDAAATLEPPERALVNLWVNQGLGDAEVARMTGMSDSVIAERRARIVEHLSEELGLPPEDIRGALDTIVPTPEADAPDAAAPEPEAPSANGSAAMAATEVAPDADARPVAPGLEPAAAEEPTAAEAPARSPSARRRLLWIGLILVVLVVLIVALTSGGSSPRPRAAVTCTRSATSTAAVTSPPSPPAASPPATSPAPLLVVPGGPAQASGSVRISRSGHTVRLDLSVRNLPPASLHGHYEVWLYDSLIYSEDLGRVRNGVTHVSLRMPADASHYRWIDVSFQPLGRVFHSGESILRSTNPLSAKVAPSSP